MSKNSKIRNILSKDGLWFILYYILRFSSLDRILSDKLYLKIKYRCFMGKPLHLDPPITFNEKLQWLKLYDHNPIYTTMADKYAVKKFVAEKIGEQYIIPTLGVWDNVESIDFNSLPNQFALKTTHDSGGVCICKDIGNFDIEAAKKKLSDSLKTNFYLLGREWPYEDVPKRIIAEKYMEDLDTKELRDYKFFCFLGEVKMMFIATDRQNRVEPYFDFYDRDFNHLDIINGHPQNPLTPSKPTHYSEMIRLAEKLSQGIPHVRVDFYEVNGNIYFGEYTFFHHSGCMPMEPEEWDYKMGEWIKI